MYHGIVIKAVAAKVGNTDEMKDDIKNLNETIAQIKREVTPNGKNTERLGDTAARTEVKVDILTEIIKSYTEKVDEVTMKLERHLGFHEGESE
jgi:chromosome segregation ATPase